MYIPKIDPKLQTTEVSHAYLNKDIELIKLQNYIIFFFIMDYIKKL